MAYKFRMAAYKIPATSVTYVAVGDDGHVAVSTNLNSGSAWTIYSVPNTVDDSYALGYGKDATGTNVFLLATIDNTDSLLSSSAPVDGAGTWDTADPGNVTAIRDVAFSDFGSTNNDKSWIGGGASGEVIRFSSGSWANNYLDLGTDHIWSVATDGNQNWVLTTSTSGRQFEYRKSTDDGANWSLSFSEGWVAGAKNQNKHVAYGNGVWVATNRGRIHSATDSDLGSNSWTLRATTTNHVMAVQYGSNSKWMAVDGSRNVYLSTDNGTNWTQKTDINGSNVPQEVAYYDGTWIIVTDGTTNNIQTSTDDGENWTSIASTGGVIRKIATSVILPNT